MERILEMLRSTQPPADAGCDVYVIHQGEAASLLAMRVAEGLRTVGLDVVLHCATAAGIGSFKSQMKRADASGAAFAVIFGDDEVAANEATVRPLVRDPAERRDGGQQRVPLDALTVMLVDALVGAGEAPGSSDDATTDVETESQLSAETVPQTLH